MEFKTNLFEDLFLSICGLYLEFIYIFSKRNEMVFLWSTEKRPLSYTFIVFNSFLFGDIGFCGPASGATKHPNHSRPDSLSPFNISFLWRQKRLKQLQWLHRKQYKKQSGRSLQVKPINQFWKYACIVSICAAPLSIFFAVFIVGAGL